MDARPGDAVMPGRLFAMEDMLRLQGVNMIFDAKLVEITASHGLCKEGKTAKSARQESKTSCLALFVPESQEMPG